MSDKPQKVECLSDWLAYYQILIDDIKYAKRQQWNLCYYALLIFGAIVGLTQIENLNLKNYIDEIRWIAMSLATFISCFLIQFQFDIVDRSGTEVNTYRTSRINQSLKVLNGFSWRAMLSLYNAYFWVKCFEFQGM